MAQRLFTGQYGPLSQVDTRPIIAAGQAWGQAIQGTLENVGKAIEKHRLNKEWEQTEPEVRSLMESQGMPADEIEVALKAAKSYGAKAGPEAYRMAREFAQQQQQAESIRLNQESLRQQMEARKEQQLAQTISDLEQSASYYMSQGREVPESIRAALYRHNLNRGGSLEASAGRIMQGSQNIKQSQEVADQMRRARETDIAYKETITGATALQSTINQFNLLKSLNPEIKPFVEQLESAQKEYDAVVNNKSIPVKGYGTFSLAELNALEKEDEKKFEKIKKILQDPNSNTKYLQAVAAEQEMARRNQDLLGGIKVYVDKSQPEPMPQPEPTQKPSRVPSPPVTLDSPMTPGNILKLGIQALPPAKDPFKYPKGKKYGQDLSFDIGMYGGM